MFCFSIFTSIDRISELRCQDKNCKDKKKEWGLLDHIFNEKNKTLNLYLDTSFHYTRPYLFKLCYNAKFKSQLTLRFNVTKILKGKILNVEATKMKEPRKIPIEVPNLCKILRENHTIHPAMFTFSNGDSIEEAKIVYDETEQKSWLNIDASFNYSKTYQLRCSKNNLMHLIMEIKFTVKEIKQEAIIKSASIGPGIACAIFLFAIGIVLIANRQKSKQTLSKLTSSNQEEEEIISHKDDLVDICGLQFPKSTIKDWKDITLGKELGGGQFGKVYKGFLHLSDYQR